MPASPEPRLTMETSSVPAAVAPHPPVSEPVHERLETYAGNVHTQPAQTIVTQPSPAATMHVGSSSSATSNQSMHSVQSVELDEEYRHDFEFTLSNRGQQFEDFIPAYRFGHYVATSPRFPGQDWDTVAEYAREYWEERNPGTWQQYYRAIRFGWENMRQPARRAA
jgi:hypothetical protein